MSTLTAPRPVRIHLAMEDGPLPRSIRQVLPLVGNESSHVYVESAEEADLIIFTDVRAIEKGYNKERTYAYLRVRADEKGLHLPENCVDLSVINIFVGLIGAIDIAREKLAPIAELVPPPQDGTTPLRADALNILVIDDTPANIASAVRGLAGHKLSTATGYEDAMTILESQRFDVVLTDLHLPMSSQTMGTKFRLGELVPYGILLMIEAAHRGATYVAVVTDLSHHDDPFSAAFDHFSRFSVQIDGAKVVMMHSPMQHDAKDWAVALVQLMKD